MTARQQAKQLVDQFHIPDQEWAEALVDNFVDMFEEKPQEMPDNVIWLRGQAPPLHNPN